MDWFEVGRDRRRGLVGQRSRCSIYSDPRPPSHRRPKNKHRFSYCGTNAAMEDQDMCSVRKRVLQRPARP